MTVDCTALGEKANKKRPTPDTVKEPLPWELQGNSVDEVISVLEEVSPRVIKVFWWKLVAPPHSHFAASQVADFRRWAASMRQLRTSNAIAAQFGGSSLQKR